MAAQRQRTLAEQIAELPRGLRLVPVAQLSGVQLRGDDEATVERKVNKRVVDHIISSVMRSMWVAVSQGKKDKAERGYCAGEITCTELMPFGGTCASCRSAANKKVRRKNRRSEYGLRALQARREKAAKKAG